MGASISLPAAYINKYSQEGVSRVKEKSGYERIQGIRVGGILRRQA